MLDILASCCGRHQFVADCHTVRICFQNVTYDFRRRILAGFVQLRRWRPELREVKGYVYKHSNWKNAGYDRVAEDLRKVDEGADSDAVLRKTNGVCTEHRKPLIVRNLTLEPIIHVHLPYGTLTTYISSGTT